MSKKYADAGQVIGDGLKQYVNEVTEKSFPGADNYFGIKDEEYNELVRLVEREG
jgi:ketopantoate hydroxymethyltransferase